MNPDRPRGPEQSRVVVSKSTPEQKARAAALYEQAKANKSPLEMGSAEDEAETTPDIAPPMLLDEGPVENLAAKPPVEAAPQAEKPAENVEVKKSAERVAGLDFLEKVDISEGTEQVTEAKKQANLEAARKKALEAYEEAA